MSEKTRIYPVALAQAPGYTDPSLARLVAETLQAADFAPRKNERILVKANLLRATADGLACTHPAVVKAACQYVLDHGASVRVGDSPGFGSARSVARDIGLTDALAPLGVAVINLDHPTIRRLPCGLHAGISRRVYDHDRLLNLPKLKAHGQMRVTGAVKNLFGCVAGVRKAVAHFLHGDKQNRFPSLLLDVREVLPPTHSLLDGIVAMHVKGPVDGSPYALGLLASAASPLALDTALYTLLGLNSGDVPIWQEAVRRGLPDSDPANLFFPLEQPGAFETGGLQLPQTLKPESFNPVRLTVSTCRRIWARRPRIR